MKNHVGIWIDHRKAVIAFVNCNEEKIMTIPSHVERQFSRMAPAKSVSMFEPQLYPADDNVDRAFAHHLNVFYGRVIALIRECESLQIFGPGEAKIEFAKQLERVGLHQRIAALETADKMTDPQIMAKARAGFSVVERTSRMATHAA